MPGLAAAAGAGGQRPPRLRPVPPSGPGGRHEPWALQVLEIEDGAVVGFTAFLDTASLFPLFGLPGHPDG